MIVHYHDPIEYVHEIQSFHCSDVEEVLNKVYNLGGIKTPLPEMYLSEDQVYNLTVVGHRKTIYIKIIVNRCLETGKCLMAVCLCKEDVKF